jgi:hypothetical protein
LSTYISKTFISEPLQLTFLHHVRDHVSHPYSTNGTMWRSTLQWVLECSTMQHSKMAQTFQRHTQQFTLKHLYRTTKLHGITSQ